MNWYTLFVFCSLLGASNCANGQEYGDDFEEASSYSNRFLGKKEGTEVGVDGYLSASTNGGNFSIGMKYGVKFGKYLIVGPSARYQRVWNNNILLNETNGFNIFGAGVFAHARFFESLFVGAELDMMRTPVSYTIITTNHDWVPCLFLGGGYSQEFNESWRVNVGVMYDIINRTNSPFRNSYLLQNAQGVRIPMIYRLTFFIPIS